MRASAELSREREADELAAVVDRASTQGEDVINAIFVRAALLVLLWMVAYLAVRLLSGYWVARIDERRGTSRLSVERVSAVPGSDASEADLRTPHTAGSRQLGG